VLLSYRIGRFDVLLTLGLAILYVGAARLGFALAFQAEQVSAVWPPTGLALAAMVRFRWRALAGVLLGAFVANLSVNEPGFVAVGISAGNTLEAVAGAAALRFLRFDGHLARVRDVLSLLAAAFGSPVIAATIGVACLVAGGVQPAASFSDLWKLWWIGDALGALIVAPALLVWSEKDVAPRGAPKILEGLVLLAGLFASSAFAFSRLPAAQLSEYVVFPFLIWAALRFGPLGSATVALLTYAFEAWATYLGVGPFSEMGPGTALVLLQIFMAIAAITGLLLAAVTAQNLEAQRSAQLSEQRLLLALRAARAGVWQWNLATGEARRSEGLNALLGLPVEDVQGPHDVFRALIHHDDRARVEAAIQTALDTRTDYEAEFRVLRPDGTIAWIEARGRVIFDDAGSPVRMVGVAIDVTRQKHLETELRRQADALSEADRRKTEFLAMLSHELRNPLAPIVNAVELLKATDKPTRAKAQEIIGRQSAQLARIVDDLLDVSRISRGLIHLERKRVELAELVQTAVEEWRHFIEQRKQQLSVQIPEQPVWLNVDPTRFAQIISNLLHNSAKFTPDGGRIAIRAEEHAGWLTLSVTDTGAGISPRMLGHVFDVFVQGPPPIDRPQGGLGLGLALVRRLVELHGGTVDATSEGPGRGSEFRVRVPSATAPEQVSGAAAGKTPAPEKRRGRRVMLVEDNQDARETLHALLTNDGHEVRAFGEGASALAEARAFAPEVGLLDLGLPGMDGYALAKALRAIPQCKDALLVAVSGYGQAQDRAKSKAAGFDEHLVKPVDPERLRALVYGAKERGRARA
jgi:two-component system CheB/CheR fusion protein